MKAHYFEVGQEVFFVARLGIIQHGEIIATHGPWLWVDDGGGLHTVHFKDADYDSNKVEPEAEACW